MIRKKAKKRGKLIDHGVRLMPHEAMTMEFFLDEGNDIELVIPSNTMKNKSADWLLWGRYGRSRALEQAIQIRLL